LWDGLARGNREFVAGKIVYNNIASLRAQLRDHQSPPITILGCADSRVPPELVFNQSLGSLFVVRSAGNVADGFGVASIEFAVANGYTKLIVVLAHAECGAVKAAVGSGEPPTPALRDLVKRIRMSFYGLKWDGSDPAMLDHAIEMNAHAAAASLLAESMVIRDAVMDGKVQIVSAYYDFATGAVRRVD
jgi:carbonic anhydrase